MKAAADKRNEELGVLLVDLDNFNYGHIKGDKVLRDVSGLLKRITKKDYLIARWGGDEFIILAPNAAKEEQQHFIRTFQTKLENNKPVDLSSFGASIGNAVYPENGYTFNELIQHADREMYRRKGEVPSV